MKYLKLYENINFDDISEEEYDIDIDTHIKPGDKLAYGQRLYYWFNNYWYNYYNYFNTNFINKSNFIIDKIELSNNVNGNPYGEYNKFYKKIPDGIIIFSIKNDWAWYKYDKNIKI